MCNFIIRPVDCYATVNIELDDELEITQGQKVKVSRVNEKFVVIINPLGNEKNVPLEVFVHAFSLKDPNAKEKKESK